jgi:hypothetical protein
MMQRVQTYMQRFARAHARRIRITLLAVGGVIIVGVGIFIAFPTRAVPGDFAVYREAVGYDTISTTPTALSFDTTVSEGTGFSIDGADTNITLSEQGHYFGDVQLAT